MRRFVTVLITGLLLAVAAPAMAQESTRCAVLFPETSWVAVPDTTVDIGGASVPQARLDRFAREIEESASAIAAEVGGLETSTVCLVDRSSNFVPSGYIPETERFHAVLDGPTDVLVLTTESVAVVKPAAAWGLAQLALWNQSGGAGWPEPLASAIAHWYRGRSLGRLDLYHRQAMGLNYGGDYGLDFSTEPRIDWTESAQLPVQVWDPADNESPIGDFIEYTTTSEGTAVLLDTSAAAWTDREGRWRVANLEDLTGRTEPTTGWKIGLAITTALVVFAGAVAVGGFLAKRRTERRRAATPPPIPGFFSKEEEPEPGAAPRR